MADQLNEVQMSAGDKMEAVRNLFLLEETAFMTIGKLPEKGKGVVVLDQDGKVSIIGLKKGKGDNHWNESVSRVENDNETRDTLDFPGGQHQLVHTRIKDAINPAISKDEFVIADKDNQITLEMKGQCEQKADGSQDCTYKFVNHTFGSPKFGGESATVHTITTRVDEGKDNKLWNSKSTIEVTSPSRQQKSELNFDFSRNASAYEYKRLSP